MKTPLWAWVVLLLLSVAGSAQIVDEVPRQTAETWLALIDNGKFTESWQAASPLFQKAISEPDWIEKISRTRKAHGAMETRNFLRARFVRDPEGMPKGEYFALEYETEFKKIKIRELAVVMRDATGLWQMASYSITTQTPKPMQ